MTGRVDVRGLGAVTIRVLSAKGVVMGSAPVPPAPADDAEVQCLIGSGWGSYAEALNAEGVRVAHTARVPDRIDDGATIKVPLAMVRWA